MTNIVQDFEALTATKGPIFQFGKAAQVIYRAANFARQRDCLPSRPDLKFSHRNNELLRSYGMAEEYAVKLYDIWNQNARDARHLKDHPIDGRLAQFFETWNAPSELSQISDIEAQEIDLDPKGGFRQDTTETGLLRSIQFAKDWLKTNPACLQKGSWQKQAEITAPVFMSQDAQEGSRAFAEKRKPNWQGK